MGEQLTLPDTLTRGLIRATPPDRANGGVVPIAPIVARLRADGLSWHGVARHLNATGVRTPSGHGRWYGETVRRHLDPAAHAAYVRAWRAGVRLRSPRR